MARRQWGLNKQIAAELGVSEITVKVRRGNVMRKMHANSLADPVKMANKFRVSVEKERNLGRSSIAERVVGLRMVGSFRSWLASNPAGLRILE